MNVRIASPFAVSMLRAPTLSAAMRVHASPSIQEMHEQLMVVTTSMNVKYWNIPAACMRHVRILIQDIIVSVLKDFVLNQILKLRVNRYDLDFFSISMSNHFSLIKKNFFLGGCEYFV